MLLFIIIIYFHTFIQIGVVLFISCKSAKPPIFYEKEELFQWGNIVTGVAHNCFL